jgi:hypothetical protein
MGQWLTTGTSVGVVSVQTGGSDLTWAILNGEGQKIERTFGKKGDLVVSAGDFNGNGTADAAVVRLKNGKAEWQVRYDLFTTETVNEATFTFGKAGDRIFYASLDGSVDWIGALRKGSGGRSLAQMRNLVSGETRKFTRLPKFASTGSRPRAFPIHQLSGSDLLGFHITKGDQTQLRVYTLQGGLVENAPMEGKGDSAVGEFQVGGGNDGYELLFQGLSESGIVSPTNGEITVASNFGGTVVDEINVGTVGAATPNDSSGGGGGSGGGSVATCSETVGWPSSHIYKTIGSTHFTDVRRNTAGVILKVGARGPFPGCVEALDSSGKVIAKLGLYARGAGWAARYYAGIGCGAGTPFNGARLASLARSNTGSSRIYMKFGNVCYGTIEASRCIGSGQC